MGSDGYQISIGNRPNSDPEPIMRYYLVAGQLVAVTQMGTALTDCNFGLSATNLSFQLSGGTQSVNVNPTYGGCTWLPWSTADWITVSPGTLRTGPGTVTITTSYFPGTGERIGIVLVGSQAITVQQQGDDCALTVDTTPVMAPAAGVSGITRAVTIPPSCGWSAASSSNDVLAETLVNGSLSTNPAGNGQVRITVTNNTTFEPRFATIAVAHGGDVRYIDIIQDALGGGTGGAGPSGPVEYYHSDALGSVRMITNAAGGQLSRHDYLPFGQELGGGANPSGNKLFFTGKERDPELTSGAWGPLDYFGARYYASQMGRFTRPDPFFNIDASLVEPQRWNRYVYVSNNPLRYVDPLGLYQFEVACGEGNTQCLDQQQAFRNALGAVREAANMLQAGSAERKRLERALKAIGEKEGSGATIAFGLAGESSAGPNLGLANPFTKHITLNLDAIASVGHANSDTFYASVVAHEGTHVAGRPIIGRALAPGEGPATMAESFVFQGLRVNDLSFGLWRNEWLSLAPAERERLRTQAVRRMRGMAP